MSLDRYLKTWTTDCVKMVYPYEKFGSIDEIRAQLDFPEFEEFRSSLKHDIDVDIYNECREMYYKRINLPSGHPDKWLNFEDYLKFYNLSDVEPASFALIRQFETYLANFGSYPNHFSGLPSFAKHAMFSLYDKKCSNIFTFPDNSEATTIFRQNIIGGLTNVYKRHVTLDANEDAAHAAKFSKRGKQWKRLEFWDINSMYPSTFKEKFPCGLGFEWSVGLNGLLKKKLMTKKRVSVESLQWLDYMQQEWLKFLCNIESQRCIVI